MPQKEGAQPLPEAKYPEITRLLETEDFDRVNRDFTKAYAELERISKSSKGMKKAADARKSMKAIERTMDILRELLRRKYEVEEKKKSGSPPADR